jgi:hypothetical protein
VVNFTPWPLNPLERAPVPIVKKVGLAWTTWRSEILDSNSDLSVVQAVASRYTDCTILALNLLIYVVYMTKYFIDGKIRCRGFIGFTGFEPPPEYENMILLEHSLFPHACIDVRLGRL